MRCIDANVILRYILNDHTELSQKAKKLISEYVVETPIEVLCEVVFVLKRVYGISQKDVSSTLINFYEDTNCILPHREAVLTGLKFYGEKNLDFVDCILAGYYESENIVINTFDSKLKKLLTSISESK